MIRIELTALVVLALLGLVPEPYTSLWGYVPEGARGTALLIAFLVILAKRL